MSVCEAQPDRSVASIERRQQVLAVFDHYRTYHPRSHQKPNPKSKEWRNIEQRLSEGCTVDDLKQAIDGMHRTPHNVGQNDRGTTYLDLELCVRSGSHVTRFRENMARYANGPPSSLTKTNQQNLRAVQEWIEMGDAHAAK